MKLPKAYNPNDVEEDIYRTWEESGFFNPDVCVERGITPPDAETFSMVLPPPNVTGTLHIGHAYESTLQDIITRFERMRGKRTVWIPGTDHAAIATQAKVEDALYTEEKKTRHDLGRKTFLDRVTTFALESQTAILRQLRKMGVSLDWGRLAYTLDDQRKEAVVEAFRRMFDAGLIYRDDRVINWDPKGQTTVSDDEVEHKPTTGTLYTFRYDVDFPIAIATTRPETKLGDTAVAVHPNDERYRDYVGKTLTATFAGVSLELTIVADDAIDPEFGTGAVGITPAHSMTDWEIAQRHGLPLKQVIDEEARIINTNTDLDGKTTLEAREAIVTWLRDNNVLETTEDIEQNIATAERTDGIIEPLPKKQWFISVDTPFTISYSTINGIASGSETTLKAIMEAAVASGQVTITPPQFEKRYFHWVNNLRDWCISRQIWFGHRIPVFYCNQKRGSSKSKITSPNIVIAQERPEQCPHCRKCTMTQDPDTLDTWFSSGLWTFSTLGWPHITEDLQTFHPTTLMNPGYEILFLWVSRMVLFSGFLLGDIPFRTALIHGMVRDNTGRKFSKSSGIGGDPLEVIAESGADALRMALVTGVAIGNDPTFDREKVKAYKHFANKIWNASKFVLMNLSDNFDYTTRPTLADRQQQHHDTLASTIVAITDHIQQYRLHLASEDLYHYFWHTFADVIIEEEKEAIYGDDPEERRPAEWLLYHTLRTALIMLHPFMPFVTEHIWSHMPEDNLLMVEPWPN